MALHRLVGIHRVQAGRVQTGQPRTAGCLTVAHDHDAERILGVLEPVRQLAALVLAADVRLPLGTVAGASGHHHFHHAGSRTRSLALQNRVPLAAVLSSGELSYVIVVVGAGPVGTQRDERVVEVHGWVRPEGRIKYNRRRLPACSRPRSRWEPLSKTTKPLRLPRHLRVLASVGGSHASEQAFALLTSQLAAIPKGISSHLTSPFHRAPLDEGECRQGTAASVHGGRFPRHRPSRSARSRAPRTALSG